MPLSLCVRSFHSGESRIFGFEGDQLIRYPHVGKIKIDRFGQMGTNMLRVLFIGRVLLSDILLGSCIRYQRR